MLRWDQLHENLGKAAESHQQLASRFNKFAMFVDDQLLPHTFHIKGIAVVMHLDHGFFVTTFAGRTLHFVFSSSTAENGALIGNIRCYLKNEFPEPKCVEIGGLNFAGSGQTNLFEPENKAPITIDNDLQSLYVVLHFIQVSLSKS